MREREKKTDALLVSRYFQRALAYEKLGKYDKALQDLTQCVYVDSNFADGYFNRSGIYKLMNNIKAAIDDLSKAIELQPGNLDFVNNRLIYYREIGDYKTASLSSTSLKQAVLNSGGKADIYRDRNDVHRHRRNLAKVKCRYIHKLYTHVPHV